MLSWRRICNFPESQSFSGQFGAVSVSPIRRSSGCTIWKFCFPPYSKILQIVLWLEKSFSATFFNQMLIIFDRVVFGKICTTLVVGNSHKRNFFLVTLAALLAGFSSLLVTIGSHVGKSKNLLLTIGSTFGRSSKFACDNWQQFWTVILFCLWLLPTPGTENF